MKQLIIRGLDQREHLNPEADVFDLVIGYVDDDERSINNLRTISAQMAPSRIAYLPKISPTQAVEDESDFGRKECLRCLDGFEYLEWTDTSSREIAGFLYGLVIKRGDGKVDCKYAVLVRAGVEAWSQPQQGVRRP